MLPLQSFTSLCSGVCLGVLGRILACTCVGLVPQWLPMGYVIGHRFKGLWTSQVLLMEYVIFMGPFDPIPCRHAT